MNEVIDPVKFCEEKYPEMMKAYREIQEADYKLFCKKQMDYGPGNISMGTSLETEADVFFSLSALNIRMNDKMQRLLNLINKHRRLPQNEPIEDAYLDLSVYGTIARIVQSNKWGK
jgi:hypothetical protein